MNKFVVGDRVCFGTSLATITSVGEPVGLNGYTYFLVLDSHVVQALEIDLVAIKTEVHHG